MRKLIMNEIKFDSNIFSRGMLLKGSTKTGSALSKEKERLCKNCLEYNNPKPGMCIPVGKIKNPNTVIYCSFWKEKLEEIIKTKRCSVCEEVKPIEAFYKDKSSDDGHQYKCSKCAIEYGINWQRIKKTNYR